MSHPKLKTALTELSAANKKLTKARQQLAQYTKPGDPSVLVDPAWAWAEKLFTQRRQKLLAIEGVVGCGLGFRRKEKNKLQTSEPCISVLVRKKITKTTLKKRGRKIIPKFVRSGKRRLRVDVVQFGQLQRQAAHAGDSLGPMLNNPSKGTLGAFAQDLESPGTVAALTAMHVVPNMEEYPDESGESVAFSVPSRFDDPNAQTFGYLRRGTMTGVDAAKIAPVSPQTALNGLPGIGEIKGWRPIAYPGDGSTVVRTYGTVSHFQEGSIVISKISLPHYHLEDAILVDIYSEPGDSGAALVDPENLLLGFLAGMDPKNNNLRVYCPASLVLRRLGCDIPTQKMNN